MLVSIYSDNPEMMSVLHKNSESFEGIQLRSMRNGVAIGRIMGPNRYDMVFQDTKYSFSEDATNQIDFMSYCSPQAFMGMMSLYLRHVLVDAKKYWADRIPWLGKAMDEIDVSGYQHELRIENLYADGFSVGRGSVLTKFFPEVSLEHKSGRLYAFTVRSNKSLFHLLNLASLCMLYTAATNKQKWWIPKELVTKYIRILHNLRPVPYFILHLFNRHCIRKREDFEEFKPALEQCADNVELIWGNTQVMRLQEVGQRMVDSDTIPYNVVEIGCGEMDYPRQFLYKVDPQYMWYANDLTNYSHIASRVRRYTGCDNLWFTTEIEEIPEIDSVYLMLIEVIEHMPLEDAKTFLKNLLDRFQPAKGLITTPNKAFNINFEIERLRHSDHHFEFAPEEFRQFILDIVTPMGYEVEFFGIGDRVGDNYLSLGAEIIRSKE